MKRFVLVGLVVVGCGSEEPGLPEGESVWTGELEAAGFALDAELTVTNTGGDLAGTVEFANETIGEGSYGVTGTYEPTSHRIALAPEDWIDTPGLFTP
ncbi:MAG: hypothetical protein KC621_23360, partial [Myxococcales bacterium]|nr:hypothetical protein [Myxococcales bacterium]